MKNPRGDDRLPIQAFAKSEVFGEWMKKHHASSDGIWLKFFKKNSGVPSINYAQALDVALSWGWIDSQKKSLDGKSYLQKFTPRRSKSIWSQNNRVHAVRLIKQRRMRSPGLKEIARAKADGRWDSAYGSQAAYEPPKDFLIALAKNKKAEAFYADLNKANTYAIGWRITTAKKPETRNRRIRQFVKMLSERKKLH